MKEEMNKIEADKARWRELGFEVVEDDVSFSTMTNYQPKKKEESKEE